MPDNNDFSDENNNNPSDEIDIRDSNLKKKVADIPFLPGCYLFKNKDNNIIYVGKAKSLKKRVLSYFQKKDHDPKTASLATNIYDIDFFVTTSETESLILENNLIKKHMPKYNINLKDSKRYAYLLITNEKFPRILTARDRNDEGQVFGPFVSGEERVFLQDFLIRTFNIRTCKTLPKKECLRYHLKLCDAPCIGKISKDDYDKRVELCISVLKGDVNKVINHLTEQMEVFKKNQEYESAIPIRNHIAALEGLKIKQLMEQKRKGSEDIINFIVNDDKVYLMIFNIYKGILDNREEYIFENTEDFFEEFIIRHYSDEDKLIPNSIIVPQAISDAVSEFFTKLKGSKVTITVPEKGDKKILLELAKKNIDAVFFKGKRSVIELKNALKLIDLPITIECFDISHLSGTLTVASMVQFVDGKANKSGYRRFRIRSVEGIDDFKSMEEVVLRRYKRLIIEKKPMPDLVIIDGGLGQLHAAMHSLNDLNVQIPIISLAKRLEEIYIPDNNEPIVLDKKSPALQLLQQVRDEAHRFAISYNRLLRKKKMKDDEE